MQVNGPVIKRLRTDAEWTGAEFARECGISPQYLCDIEAGRRPAPIKLARKIAHTLELTLRDIAAPVEVDA